MVGDTEETAETGVEVRVVISVATVEAENEAWTRTILGGRGPFVKVDGDAGFVRVPADRLRRRTLVTGL
jgi:hypothetical protein